MNWFADNWPMLLTALAVFLVAAGLARRVAKLAFIGVALGAFGLVVWPYVTESL